MTRKIAEPMIAAARCTIGSYSTPPLAAQCEPGGHAAPSTRNHLLGLMSMIYELRVYTAMPGRLPDVLARFRDHTVDIWNRLGIRQLGYWTTAVGPDSNALTSMLVWESLADREVRTDCCEHGQLVLGANLFLTCEIVSSARTTQLAGMRPTIHVVPWSTAPPLRI
jgi:hypothetical protein